MKHLTRLLAGSAVAAALAFSATPAFAISITPTLPAGQSMYVVNCDNVHYPYVVAQVNVADATATAVGTSPMPGSQCYGQGAWDAATNTAYVIHWTPTTQSLATVNLVTGVATDIALTHDSGNAPVEADALAISPSGTAYLTSGSTIYTVDLATAEVSNPLPLLDGSSNTEANWYALAFNPSDGLLYGIASASGAIGNIPVARIDPATGTVTVLSTNPFSGADPYSLQFDSSGMAWIEVDAPSSAELHSATITNVAGTDTLQGVLSYLGTNFYSESFLITPAIPSAPTGVTASPGDGQATVSWTASVGATSYTVTTSPGGATCTAAAPATSCTVTGLANGTAYSFTVTASSGAGTSAASTPATATPVAVAKLAATGAPLAPMGVLGLLIMGAGASLLMLARRRRSGVTDTTC